jgi:hypothetical protein
MFAVVNVVAKRIVLFGLGLVFPEFGFDADEFLGVGFAEGGL